MPDLAKAAARLIALLDEIELSENAIRNAVTDPYSTALTISVNDPGLDFEKVYAEEGQRLTKEYAELKTRHEFLRVELGQIANALAATAHTEKIEWTPVLRLYADWNPDHDQIADAKAAALMLGAVLPPPQHSPVDYVDLNQAAALVNRSKRTLERAQSDPKKKMPLPAIQGVGGKKSEWRWSELKPWLEAEYDRKLPDRPPHVGE